MQSRQIGVDCYGEPEQEGDIAERYTPASRGMAEWKLTGMATLGGSLLKSDGPQQLASTEPRSASQIVALDPCASDNGKDEACKCGTCLHVFFRAPRHLGTWADIAPRASMGTCAQVDGLGAWGVEGGGLQASGKV